MAQDTLRAERTDYELLDAGVGRRLERFGQRIVDRPAPGALDFRADSEAWRGANLRFDPGAGWSGDAAALEPWQIAVDGLTLELRPTASGGIGLYPEHRANLAWLEAQMHRPATPDPPPAVLNLFAHTGLATLAAARAGASVAHVDSARTAVSWARHNAKLSGLADRSIRWLVDDAMAFVAREARRGRRYDGIVLDPPSFGHAGRRAWRLEEDLPDLLIACRAIAADDAFVLLTAHTEGIDGVALSTMLEAAFRPRTMPMSTDTWPLRLGGTSGVTLELGWAAALHPPRSQLSGQHGRRTCRQTDRLPVEGS